MIKTSATAKSGRSERSVRKVQIIFNEPPFFLLFLFLLDIGMHLSKIARPRVEATFSSSSHEESEERTDRRTEKEGERDR